MSGGASRKHHAQRQCNRSGRHRAQVAENNRFTDLRSTGRPGDADLGHHVCQRRETERRDGGHLREFRLTLSSSKLSRSINWFWLRSRSRIMSWHAGTVSGSSGCPFSGGGVALRVMLISLIATQCGFAGAAEGAEQIPEGLGVDPELMLNQQELLAVQGAGYPRALLPRGQSKTRPGWAGPGNSLAPGSGQGLARLHVCQKKLWLLESSSHQSPESVHPPLLALTQSQHCCAGCATRWLFRNFCGLAGSANQGGPLRCCWR